MSSATTQAWGGVGGSRAGRAPPPRPHAHPRRGHGRRLPRRPRPDGRRHGAAADHHRPRRQRPLHVGVHRLPADVDDQRPDLRQALRPVRPAARSSCSASACSWSARCSPACRSEMWQLIAAAASRASAPARCSRSRWRSSRDLFAPSERGRYQGLFGAVFGLSSLLGPAIGGLITDTIGWHLVFFVNMPIGAVVLLDGPALPAGVPPRPATGRRSTTSARRCSRPRSSRSSSASPTSRRPTGPTRRRRADRPRARRSSAVFVWVESRAAEPIVPLEPVPEPRVHDLGRVGLPRGVRVLRGGRLPAALVPGRRRRLGDDLGLPDPAAARRPDLQRHRLRPDRGPDRPLQVADRSGRSC